MPRTEQMKEAGHMDRVLSHILQGDMIRIAIDIDHKGIVEIDFADLPKRIIIIALEEAIRVLKEEDTTSDK